MMDKLLLELPAQLETKRLLLRCYRPGDGPMYYQAGLRNRDHLQRFEAENALRCLNTVEDAEIFVRRFALDWAARNFFMWGVFERSTGGYAGQVYVGPVDWDIPEFEVGYIADVNHEGKGYITEAVQAVLGFIFNDLQARRASINCSPENLRSQRVAERCGFRLEGRTRQNHRSPDGTLEDSLHYGLLRDEFLSIRQWHDEAGNLKRI